VLVLGITFKENCPDIRNSRVIDVIHELKSFGCEVDVYDPWANPTEVKHEYGLELLSVVFYPLSVNSSTTDNRQLLCNFFIMLPQDLQFFSLAG
jgi:UDP-glucose 6-dehydrogenase